MPFVQLLDALFVGCMLSATHAPTDLTESRRVGTWWTGERGEQRLRVCTGRIRCQDCIYCTPLALAIASVDRVAPLARVLGIVLGDGGEQARITSA